MLVKNLFLAGSAALTPIILSSFIDANPSLYLYDKFISTNEKRMQTFSDKRIWITGASTGIGAELAKQLSSHGASLVLSARDETKLNAVAEECYELQRSCRTKKKRREIGYYSQQHTKKISYHPLMLILMVWNKTKYMSSQWISQQAMNRFKKK